VPARHGRFGLDEDIEHVMTSLRTLGADTNAPAVCQPAVPVLAAVSLLAAADDVAQPSRMTLIAGPIEARASSDPAAHAPSQVSVAAVGWPA
jgi:poly(3-hydroxybutyrate) depolymerase